jgi:hypothetical protein
MRSMKKLIWIISAVVLCLIAVLFLIFHGVNKAHNGQTIIKTVKQPKSATDQRSLSDFDKTVSVDIQHKFQTDGKGFIISSTKYNPTHYLTFTQSGNYDYNSTYPGDGLEWVVDKNGKISYQTLTNNDHLIHLVEINGQTIIQSGIQQVIVFYEKEGNITQGYASKGYVYQIQNNGSLKKIFTSSGVYGGVEQDDNGNLIFIDKIFKDPLNQYPASLKPYELEYKVYQNGKWTITKTQNGKPTVSK